MAAVGWGWGKNTEQPEAAKSTWNFQAFHKQSSPLQFTPRVRALNSFPGPNKGVQRICKDQKWKHWLSLLGQLNQRNTVSWRAWRKTKGTPALQGNLSEWGGEQRQVDDFVMHSKTKGEWDGVKQNLLSQSLVVWPWADDLNLSVSLAVSVWIYNLGLITLQCDYEDK